MRYAASSYSIGETPLSGTDAEWSTIVNALRTAAEVWMSDSAQVRDAGNVILAYQMVKQSREATALADKIAEEAGV